MTATNAGGSTAASSAATAVVLPLAPVNTSLPTVSGSNVEAQTQTAGNGAWSGSPTSFAYQWEDCNSSGTGSSNIGGATASTYKLLSGDVGHTIRLVVTATNAGGSAAAASPASAVVLPLAPVNTSPPTVTGSDVEGETLTAGNGSWSGNPTSVTRRWEDCNSSGGSCSNINGASGSTYKLVSADVGHTIRVLVTATNAGGSTGASSAQTAVVLVDLPPAPVNSSPPTLSGSAVEGKRLRPATAPGRHAVVLCL